MLAQRRAWHRYAAALLAGLAAVTLAGFIRYQWQLEAHRGARMIVQNQGVLGGGAKMADGLFGSIIGAVLVGTVVVAAVVFTTWVTADFRTGIAMAVLSLIPLTAFNVMLQQYLVEQPLALSQGTAHLTVSPLRAAGDAFGEQTAPIFLALVACFFIAARLLDRLEREDNRPTVPSRAQRDAEWEERLARKAAEKAAQAATADDIQIGTRPGPVPAAASAAAPVAAAPAERVAVSCVMCGASNAPQRTNCLRCGAALAV